MTAITFPSGEVDDDLLNRAINSLLKHHKSTNDARDVKSDKKQLLESDLGVFLQFTLAKVPQNPTPKPIRIRIPHPLFKVEGDETSGIDVLERAEVCIIVKDESKSYVQKIVNSFPNELGCVKKVLSLTSLRTKWKKYENRRELVAKYDLFFADDRILPMLSKALGKIFLKAKKQPIPLDLSKRMNVHASIQSTFMFLSAGTCVSIKAGNTAMSPKNLAENCQSIVKEAAMKIPRKWANITGIHVKTSASAALPIYNKTPEELVVIAKLASAEKNDSSDVEEQEEVKDLKKEEKGDGKRKHEKSPLLRALKKQKEEKKKDSDKRENDKAKHGDEEKTVKKDDEKKGKRNQKSADVKAHEPDAKIQKQSEEEQDVSMQKEKDETNKDDDENEAKKKEKKHKKKKDKKKKHSSEQEEVANKDEEDNDEEQKLKKKEKSDDTTPTHEEGAKKHKKDKKKKHSKKEKDVEIEKEKEESEMEVKDEKKKKGKKHQEETETESKKEPSESKQEKSPKAKKDETPSKEKPPFVAAKKFQGEKKGYVFRSGLKGVGYYEDAAPLSDKGAINAALASLAKSKKRVKSGKKKRRGV